MTVITERALICTIAGKTRRAYDTDHPAVVARRVPAVRHAPPAWRAQFAAEIDPDNVLAEDDRERRVDALVQAELARLALRSMQARRKAREAVEARDAADAALRALGLDPDNPTAELDLAPRRKGRKTRTAA